MRRVQGSVVLVSILASSLLGAPVPAQEALSAANRAIVARLCREAEAAQAGNTNFWTRPGIVADRAAREVTVYAQTTGIGTNDPIEFFLISEASAHGYESVAVSFAEPSDIHEALTFIGVAPGHPLDVSRRRYWPKGERVLTSIGRVTPDAAAAPPVRLERLIWNRRAGAPMPETGLVFAGSYRLPPDHKTHAGGYAADVRGPNAIASNYNEPSTVLDVPHQAPQGSVYNWQFLNPAHVFSTGELVRVVFRPERPPGDLRVADLALTLAAGDPRATLADTLSGRLVSSGGMEDALTAVGDLRKAGRDPFVTVRCDDSLPLADAQRAAALLAALEDADGLRLDPPPDGELFIKAFLPDPAHRDRQKRYSQPWELILPAPPATNAATLIEIQEVWSDDQSLRPELRVNERPARDPAELRRLLTEHGPGPPVILAYADASSTYGDVMRWIRPVLKDYPTVYVFAETD